MHEWHLWSISLWQGSGRSLVPVDYFKHFGGPTVSFRVSDDMTINIDAYETSDEQRSQVKFIVDAEKQPPIK